MTSVGVECSDPVWIASVEVLGYLSGIVGSMSPSDPIAWKLQQSSWLNDPARIRRSRRRPAVNVESLGVRCRSAVQALTGLEAGPVEVSKNYLIRFVDVILISLHLPTDKLGRWIGYVNGCLAFHGHPTVVEQLAKNASRARPIDIFELSILVGYVQGYLVASRMIDVGQERDRTRPIFHRAYEASGMAPPATVSV